MAQGSDHDLFVGRVQDLMKPAGLTSNAALAARVRVSRQAVDKWFAGAWPSGDLIIRLCRVLETDPNHLLLGVKSSDQVAAADPVAVARTELTRRLRRAIDDVLTDFREPREDLGRLRSTQQDD